MKLPLIKIPKNAIIRDADLDAMDQGDAKDDSSDVHGSTAPTITMRTRDGKSAKPAKDERWDFC